MESPAKLPLRSFAIATILLVVACSPEPTRVIDLPDAQMGKTAPSSLTVTSTSPAFGERGQRELVHVFGTGFDATSAASWERNGSPDPHINVVSTTFVSSTELVADVEIAADADITTYDVAVTLTLSDGGRKKGVGVEAFAVTLAYLLPALPGAGNNSQAWNLNDAGQVVGRSNGLPFYWDSISGIVALPGSGQAYDITAAGDVIVGGPAQAVRWTGAGRSWTALPLPTACLTNVESSTANSVSPDGSLIGGSVSVTLAKNKSKKYPVVWDMPGATCRTVTVPSLYDTGVINEVSAVGLVVGGVSNATTSRAAVWDAVGAPSDPPALLAPISGATWSGGQAISPNGTIVVGLSGDRATYWYRTATGGWSGGIALAPACGGSIPQTWARAVNDAGMIVGNSCQGGRWWRVSADTIKETGLMPGLGPTDHPIAEGITNNSGSGQPWASGGGSQAPGAIYWRRP